MMSLLHPALALAVALAAAPTAEDKAAARRFKNEAFQKIAEGSYAEGVSLLRQAHDAVPHPNFLFNIAVVYDQWPGHCAESLAAFQDFFEACPDCKARPTAEARVARVEARCELELELTSVPTGADVELDGAARGQTPLALTLLPGAHQLRLEAEGFEPETRALEVTEAGPRSLSIELQPLTEPAPAPAQVAATAPRPGAGLRTAGWIALGAGAVGTGVGVAHTVLANDAVNEERALRVPGTDPALVQEARNQARDRTALAYVGYGIGAAGVATGVVLHLLAAKKKASAPVSFGTDGRRLLLSGRF